MDNANYKLIRVARDRDLFDQIGRDIYFDLVDHNRVRSFVIHRQTPFRLFKEEIAGEFGVPVEFQRFWKWAWRQNHTYRPMRPLTHEEELKPVGELREVSNKKGKELNLFLEVEFGLVRLSYCIMILAEDNPFRVVYILCKLLQHRCPVSPPVKSNKDALLFFKLYDPQKGELHYVGRLFVKSSAKPSDILGKVNEMAGFGPDEEVDLYEEIEFEPLVLCEPIDRTISFRGNQIEDGDIICFQKSLLQNAESCTYPTVPSFLKHFRVCQEMEAQNHQSDRFIWKISSFSKLTSKMYYSEVFTVASCKWQILIFPKGNCVNYISIYLVVADHTSLPIGWSRRFHFSLTVVNQNSRDFSITKETSHKFTRLEHSWGFTSFMSLTELHNQSAEFLAQDTLVVEANVVVCKAVVAPPVVAPNIRQTGRFFSYFEGLDKFIDAADTSASKEGPSSGAQTAFTVPECPSSEEVENAKQSLKECLSDLFRLNMRERLASALSTLCVAETRISCEQRKSVWEFHAYFNDFISDFLTLEKDNSEFELQKLQNDMLFSAIKKNHETHLSFKELSEKLAREEEELKKKLEKTRCRSAKLISDWEALVAESEEAKSRYISQKAKLAEAEERKRIAEERMSRSTAAWSSLKAQFL